MNKAVFGIAAIVGIAIVIVASIPQQEQEPAGRNLEVKLEDAASSKSTPSTPDEPNPEPVKQITSTPEPLTPPPKQAEISPPKQAETPSPSPVEQSNDCSGSARCFTGIVTQVIDGDTIKVEGQSIRFALTSTPELNEFGGVEAKNFIEEICFVGSSALVDEDDGQTEGSYGRIIAVIYCNGFNLNEAILDADLGILSSGFCSSSEFSTHVWAQRHGCPYEEPLKTTTLSSFYYRN